MRPRHTAPIMAATSVRSAREAMRLPVWLMAFISTVAAAAPAATQGARVTIRGVAYDSLRGEPLGNAIIAIIGASRATTSDAHGRFRLDSIAPGVHTLVMRHAALDSVGLREVSSRASVTDGREELFIAIPSFATLWRAACGDTRPPKDSGFVYGTIRDASGVEPIGDAGVEIMWTDLVVDRRRGVVQRRWHMQTRSESNGSYTLCGVPSTLRLRIQALTNTSASGRIDLPPRTARARRQDLLLGPSTKTDSTRRGTVTGILTDDAGQPFANARVVMEDMPETRSDSDGRFTIVGIPGGTRQLEVRSLGLLPVVTAVDVIAGETVTVALTLQRLATLRAMRVSADVATRRFAYEFDLRRRRGAGFSMDSSQISKYAKFTNAFHDIPSVQADYHGSNFRISLPDGRGGRCAPEVRIDGAEAEYGHLVDLLTHEVAALEVYPHPGSVPVEFQRAGIRPLCGIILVWTKYGFRNR